MRQAQRAQETNFILSDLVPRMCLINIDLILIEIPEHNYAYLMSYLRLIPKFGIATSKDMFLLKADCSSGRNALMTIIKPAVLVITFPGFL